MAKKKKLGRPPQDGTTMLKPITVRFPPAMMTEIERISAGRMDKPNTGQVVRELVAAGLQVASDKNRK